MSSRRGLTALLAAVALLSGCGLLSAEPSDDQVTTTKVRDLADAATQRVTDFRSSVLGDRSAAIEVRTDYCLVGQNNWKVRQGYDWLCRVEAGAVVDAGEVEAGLREQEDILLGLGCEPYYNGTQDVVEDVDWLITRYWDEHSDDPDYQADNLPHLQYSCPDGLVVYVFSTNARDRGDDLSSPFSWYRPHDSGNPDYTDDVIFVRELPSSAEVAAVKETASPLVLIVVVGTEYYRV